MALLEAAIAAAGVGGIAATVSGGKKMKDAGDKMKQLQERNEQNQERFKEQSDITTSDMDRLGKIELEILKSFKNFSDCIEKIKNKPVFKPYRNDNVNIPKYDAEKIEEVSIGAGVLLGGLGGAAAGTAGGFAAAGAVTAAVMTFGTASTGTAIASLSGAAAVNATLAAIGGGSIAAGGGGVALGTTILGASALGAGLLVGGIIFNIVGQSISDKADKAEEQVNKAETEINDICTYLRGLSFASKKYRKSLYEVDRIYRKNLRRLEYLLDDYKDPDWNDFSQDEQLLIENTTLLVGLLYKMCKVQLVNKSESVNKINTINITEINKTIREADDFIDQKKIA